MKKRGFTLVELLVVIGIIALLISILLPALSSARRAASTVKCSAALKSLGNAFLMYAQENKGYAPPTKINYKYNIGRLTFDQSVNVDVQGQTVGDVARWFNFVAKYVMKGQSEGSAQNAEEMGQQLERSAIWGCPSFVGFVVSSDPNSLKGGQNRNYPPYGLNRWPSFSLQNPDPNGTPHFPTPNAQYVFEGDLPGPPASTATWYKLVQFKNPGERALLGDSRTYYLEARKIDAPGRPDQIPGQPLGQLQTVYQGGTAGRQNAFDFYRHGNLPGVEDSSAANGHYAPLGGKVAYNCLFADMHVSTLTDRESGYRVLRMRFPL